MSDKFMCPICKNMEENAVCSVCGYEFANNYIAFPTLTPITKEDAEELHRTVVRAQGKYREILEAKAAEEAREAAKKRIEQERLAKEKAEKERLEKERLAKEKAEKERLEKERLAKEKAEKERQQKERPAKETVQQQKSVPTAKLNEKRNVILFFFASFFTFGIYWFYTDCKWADDMNVALASDGKETTTGKKYVLYTILTCGIYSVWWMWNLNGRMKNNPYGVKSKFSLLFLLMITVVVFGFFTVEVGLLEAGIAEALLFGYLYVRYEMYRLSNGICKQYNQLKG